MSEVSSRRLFIAVALPDEVREAIVTCQNELRRVLPSTPVSWTKAENMHLTVRFLGNVAEDKLPALREALQTATRNFGELELICERLGCFPDLRWPKVVWAWVHDAAGQLGKLVVRINDATDRLAAQPAEAQFTGHVTMARPRQLRTDQRKIVANFVETAVKRTFGSWKTSELHLIESHLSPGGSRYTLLSGFPLQSTA